MRRRDGGAYNPIQSKNYNQWAYSPAPSFLDKWGYSHFEEAHESRRKREALAQRIDHRLRDQWRTFATEKDLHFTSTLESLQLDYDITDRRI